MALQLTNTLSGKKEEFRPLNPPHVTLYVCGVTVYGDCHVGHARGAVVFDVLRRILEHRKFQVRYVRNITDVDDKIIDRARKEEGTDELKTKVQAVAKQYTDSFRADFSQLNLLPPHEEPRATEYINPMVHFIQQLLDARAAYEGKDGVYYSVRKLPQYGALSHQKLDQMMETTSLETGEGKKDPLDFALWKKAKPEEPSWESPWGPGRPGWHIECSTMSTGLLGDRFDIHGGGQDLIFPHHENERAQALGLKKPFANTWMHNGLLTVNGQKMSKSLGNIVLLRDAIARYGGEILRLFFLSAHYRSPLDFTWDRLQEAANAYEKFTTFFAHAKTLEAGGRQREPGLLQEISSRFNEAMDDDLNTPRALASLYELVEQAYRWKEDPSKHADVLAAEAKVRELGQLLGLFKGKAFELDEEVSRLIRERDEARARKDYAAADQIRKQLEELGYVLEDTAGKTVVRKRV